MASSTLVIAFHGKPFPWAKDLDLSKILERDMGYPSFVDLYFPGFDLTSAARLCRKADFVYLIGYSYGGAMIAGLTHRLGNIVGATVYESPVLEDEGLVPALPTAGDANDFPVMQIWNRKIRRPNQANRSKHCWAFNRSNNEMVQTDAKGHFRWFPPAHNWDTGVNAHIARHIDGCFDRVG